jgi:hypothetical protein
MVPLGESAPKSEETKVHPESELHDKVAPSPGETRGGEACR